MRLRLAVVVLLLTIVSPAYPEQVNRGITDVATISDGEGHSRILVHFDPGVSSEHYVIRQAILRFNLAGEEDDRVISLNAHPLTTGWNAGAVSWSGGWRTPGGDFDESKTGQSEISLARGARSISLDVTRAVKEVFENDDPWYGIIVTTDPRDGIGIDSQDVSRFAGLEEATLEMTWRKVPPKPRELVDAPGGQ